MRFDFSAKDRPVDITGRGKEKMEFTLRVMTAESREQFLAEFEQRVDRSGAQIRVTNPAGLHASLVSRCLVKRGTEEFVPIEVLQTWPADVLEALFSEAQGMNLMGAGDAEAHVESVGKA